MDWEIIVSLSCFHLETVKKKRRKKRKTESRSVGIQQALYYLRGKKGANDCQLEKNRIGSSGQGVKEREEDPNLPPN